MQHTKISCRFKYGKKRHWFKISALKTTDISEQDAKIIGKVFATAVNDYRLGSFFQISK